MSDAISRRAFFHSFKRAAAAGAVGAGALGTAATAAGQAVPAIGKSTGIVSTSEGVYVNAQKVLLWENTRKEIREALEAGRLKAAILPTGSVEQHGEHLALVCDIAMSTLLAQQAALQMYPQVLVAPPCPLGYAPYHMARKGTMTVRKETLLAYVFDVLKSLRAHGIRTVHIVNGHAGNHQLLRDALPGWRKELGITLDADSYWRGITKLEMAQWVPSGGGVSHGAEFETSLMLASYPERVRRFTMEEYDAHAARVSYEANFTPEVQEYLKDVKVQGENGRDRTRQVEAVQASAEKGQELIALATRAIVARLQKMIAATRAGTPWPAG